MQLSTISFLISQCHDNKHKESTNNQSEKYYTFTTFRVQVEINTNVNEIPIAIESAGVKRCRLREITDTKRSPLLTIVKKERDLIRARVERGSISRESIGKYRCNVTRSPSESLLSHSHANRQWHFITNWCARIFRPPIFTNHETRDRLGLKLAIFIDCSSPRTYV